MPVFLIPLMKFLLTHIQPDQKYYGGKTYPVNRKWRRKSRCPVSVPVWSNYSPGAASILQLHDDVPLLPMKLHYHVSLKKILFNIYCFCKGVPYDYKKRTFWEESGSFLQKICILIAIPIASQWMLLIRQMTPLLMHPVCM